MQQQYDALDAGLLGQLAPHCTVHARAEVPPCALFAALPIQPPSRILTTGSLSAIYLAQQGFTVDVYERRTPPPTGTQLQIGPRSFCIMLHRRWAVGGQPHTQEPVCLHLRVFTVPLGLATHTWRCKRVPLPQQRQHKLQPLLHRRGLEAVAGAGISLPASMCLPRGRVVRYRGTQMYATDASPWSHSVNRYAHITRNSTQHTCSACFRCDCHAG
jgi:hypothetical protein